MITSKRQAGNNDVRLLAWHKTIGRKRITDDLVVLLGEQTAIIDTNAGTARRALHNAVAEPLDRVGAAIALVILECVEETTVWQPVILIVATAPSVEVEHAFGTERHLRCVAKIVSKNRRAETRWERDPAIVTAATIRLSRNERYCRD